MLTRSPFGTLPTGQPVEAWTIHNAGLTVKAIAYGATVTELHVPDCHGNTADVVLGFDHLDGYLAAHPWFGATTGRVAGRITAGRFTLDGVDYALPCNDPPNHLHSGNDGLNRQLWHAEAAGESAVRFTHTSPHGHGGYPGRVAIAVTYTITDDATWRIDYEATADRPTPINLTNHAYFNLAGEGSGTIEDHVVQIFADGAAATDAAMTLLGRREAVAAANDFRSPRRLGDAIPHLWQRHGDAYFLSAKAGPHGLRGAAKISDPASGRTMMVWTTEPMLQFYTGVSLDGTFTGKGGRLYERFGALCVEAESYPDGVNTPALGDIILRPGRTYRQTTIHQFSAD